MSYDVALVIDTGRTYAEEDGASRPDPTEVWGSNYTSNCAPMWRTAGVDLLDLHDLPAPLAGEKLAAAVAAMEADPAAYRAMNPSNGWGDYESCLVFLRDFRAACHTHPLATAWVWA